MAETLTEIVQAALRAATGTSNDYYGDWHAYLTAQGIQEGQIDGRILAYGQTVDSTLNCASAAHNYFLLNGITASAYWTLPSRPTPSASVTYVTSDAEFTTALTNLSATGGTIALDPAGSYAARTFTSNPSAMIYITSGTSGGGLVNQTGRASGYARNTRASISSVAFTTAAISNYTFISVNFGTDTSHSGNLVNGTATAPYSSFNAYGCEFSGVPLTSTSYPILVNVASGASFAVGEVITGGTSLSVGTILKIATNQLYVNVTTVGGGGTTAAPFTVAETVAGNIAGSSTVSSLAQMTMYGVNNSFDGFQVHDCLFRYLNNGIKVGVGRAPGGAVSICNNEFNYITEDATAFNYGSGASEFVIAFNEFTLPLGTGSDIGAPHCDSMQFLVGDATAVWTNLKILANIGINGFSRGGFQGMPFASDLTTGFYGAKAAGNIFMYYGSSTTTGFTIDAMQNAYIFANKLGKKSAASSSTTIQRVFSTQGAGNVNRYNTYENGAGGLDTTYNYNLSNSDANYNTVYSGTWPLSAATITDALTEIKASVDYDSGGSLGSYTGYVDWTNKRLNLLLEPSIFNFGSSTGNTVSATNITSSWRKWWGDRTVNVSITGGEYQIANSDGGTPTVTWTSAAGTIAQDQWVQVRGPQTVTLAISRLLRLPQTLLTMLITKLRHGHLTLVAQQELHGRASLQSSTSVTATQQTKCFMVVQTTTACNVCLSEQTKHGFTSVGVQPLAYLTTQAQAHSLLPVAASM
jgi:hypothetical protein